MFNSTIALAAGTMALVVVCGAWGASRFSFFKKSPFRQGVFLGLLAYTAVFFLQEDRYLQNGIAFMDFPVLIAGLFFGPVVCLVSIATMLVGKIALELSSITHSVGWLTGSLGSLIVCGYTITASKLSFNNKRPTVFTGFIAAAFGECIHLAFIYAVGTGTPAFTYRVISDLF